MEKVLCDHCGDPVGGKTYVYRTKNFCCSACKNVYVLLLENNLGDFYTLEHKSGVKPKNSASDQFAFLEVEDIAQKFIDFENEEIQKVNLFLPDIHCSSCVYLLENLHRIEGAIISSQVNFTKRETIITYRKDQLSLAQIARLLDQFGYTANFGNRSDINRKANKQFMYKLGVAGFAFGSIMLWSFPEYLGIDGADIFFRDLSAFLSLLVSIPVLFYSARDYFISARKAIRTKKINLDVPIAVGIIALYAQSVYSILTLQGPGYMDSFAGFIFFLLIGKWFQNKSFKSLTFERDYTSYFPIAVYRQKAENSFEIVEIEKVQVGDVISLRSEEVLPCDSVLLSKTAKIDYSFVTGESAPIYLQKGDFIYAGGKLMGPKVLLTVQKESSRSHLTQLWNLVQKEEGEEVRFRFQDTVAKYFSVIVLIVAIASSLAWYFIDASRITEIVVAILIVACPCALALSSPFTYGNVMRKMGHQGLYVKNTSTIERFKEVTDIVFDKTGTLTETSKYHVGYTGDKLTVEELKCLMTLANSNTHPLSRAIVHYIHDMDIYDEVDLEHFEEHPGIGVSAQSGAYHIKIGSAAFVTGFSHFSNETDTSISVNDKCGKFIFYSRLRPGIEELLGNLRSYKLHILSGDKDKDLSLLEEHCPPGTQFHFEQSPQDKLHYIELLQRRKKNVLMVGDGLNDSGALQAANLGIAVSDDVFRFTPSSDAILQAESLGNLRSFLSFGKYSKRVLLICLCFSLCYNITGLSFAISGMLTPLVAAIIMPVSSITIVCLSTMLVRLRNL